MAQDRNTEKSFFFMTTLTLKNRRMHAKYWNDTKYTKFNNFWKALNTYLNASNNRFLLNSITAWVLGNNVLLNQNTRSAHIFHASSFLQTSYVNDKTVETSRKFYKIYWEYIKQLKKNLFSTTTSVVNSFAFFFSFTDRVPCLAVVSYFSIYLLYFKNMFHLQPEQRRFNC